MGHTWVVSPPGHTLYRPRTPSLPKARDRDLCSPRSTCCRVFNDQKGYMMALSLLRRKAHRAVTRKQARRQFTRAGRTLRRWRHSCRYRTYTIVAMLVKKSSLTTSKSCSTDIVPPNEWISTRPFVTAVVWHYG